MRSLILLMIVAICSAQLHEYHAESNFQCELCQEAVKLIKAHDDDMMNSLLDKFPAMKEYEPIIRQAIDAFEENVCQVAQLCASETSQLLLAFQNDKEIDTSLIELVNNHPESTWVAGENERFKGMKISEIKKMMGTVVDPLWTYKAETVKSISLRASVPETFDARQQWPQCASVIGHIRDQSNCGSCWAHGTTEAFNDRLCIKTGDTTLLSVADTTACCGFLSCLSMGCNGGQVGTPWSWFDRTGVVTGGDFGDNTTCFPYTMEKCAHHVTSTLPNCSDVQQVAPKCDKKCSGNNASYSADKKKAVSSYGFSSIDDIKQDIATYGSVTAAFTVYEDLLNYKSGVYKHLSGNALGGHAVKIIGWGADHWIVNNSWNDSWGDNGTFKIAFGECGIDSQCHAGKV